MFRVNLCLMEGPRKASMAWVKPTRSSPRIQALAALLGIGVLCLAASDVLRNCFTANATARQLASGDRWKLRRVPSEPAPGASSNLGSRSDVIRQERTSETKSLLTKILGPQALPQKDLKQQRSQEADSRCAKLGNEASTNMKVLAEQLPPRQLLPSPDAPFVFLHNRKCGGSSLRAALLTAANTLNQTAIVPCFAPLNDCYRYNIAGIGQEVLSAASVFAGHLSWDVVEDLGAEKNTS